MSISVSNRPYQIGHMVDNYIDRKYSNLYMLEDGMQVYTFVIPSTLKQNIVYVDGGFWSREADIDVINKFSKIGYINYVFGLRDPRHNSFPNPARTTLDGYEMVVIGNLK